MITTYRVIATEATVIVEEFEIFLFIFYYIYFIYILLFIFCLYLIIYILFIVIYIVDYYYDHFLNDHVSYNCDLLVYKILKNL